jgi:peptide chain release factor 1
MSFNPYQIQIDRLQKELEENQALVNNGSDPEMQEMALEEVQKLENELASLQSASQEFEDGVESSGVVAANQHINCIIELRGGVGGDEANIWANDILRAYIRLIEKLNLKFSYIDDLVIKVHGRTSALPELSKDGKNASAYQIFQYESGVHRVQRVPATESQGRIHTSTCSVAVLPEVAKTAVTIREEDLEWQFMRAGGAGGQSVNKTNSAVRLIHHPSGIVVNARQERKQSQNRDIALDMLRSQLWEIEEEKSQAQMGQARSAIGRARRSEKIRTYNFPQNRITDHRTKQSWYNLPSILEGNMEEMFVELHREIESSDSALESPKDHEDSTPEQLSAE